MSKVIYRFLERCPPRRCTWDYFWVRAQGGVGRVQFRMCKVCRRRQNAV